MMRYRMKKSLLIKIQTWDRYTSQLELHHLVSVTVTRIRIRKIKNLQAKISSAGTFSLIKILRRSRRSEKEKWYVADPESALARGINSLLHEPVSTPQDSSLHRAVFSLEPLHPIPFFHPLRSVYLSTREIPTRPIASPVSRDAHRLSIKNFIIRSHSSFVFQFDFYHAIPGKRQVHNVARSFPPLQPPDTSSTFFSATPAVPPPCPDI